ncbi:uncharacterized protein C2845_PM06G24580 [Panicum miliaceum]|uniref:Uncharacterized protein n=1 Tax=Panicum miliaceum TaxID=4540 RepID=A0A3L6R8P4_PANMI|nr:uncharacterized protein C2845_PM06G24580 [Panicum miliaceum]
MEDQEGHLGVVDLCLQMSTGIGAGMSSIHHQGSPEVQHDVNSRGGEVSRSGDPDALAIMNAATEALEAKEKQKPSFELSGKLAEETNRVAGVNLLYSEPPEARKSEIRWRLYVFKGGEPLNVLVTVDHIIANVGQTTNVPKGCQQSGFELRYALNQRSEGAFVSDLFYSVSCIT